MFAPRLYARQSWYLYVASLFLCLIKELEPYYLPSGSACYGAYTFLLEDDSANGSVLDLAVLDVYGAPRVRFLEVADGDRVRVQAEIQVPSRFGQSRGWTEVELRKAMSRLSKP